MDLRDRLHRAAAWTVLAAASVWLGSAPATAESQRIADAPAFSFPVDCDYGRTCFIQNYVDTRPGQGYADHTCGHLSYHGHDGTDIRLRDRAAMRRGVAVTAAAGGTVARTRNSMPDVLYSQNDPARIQGREAGNGVVIRHGAGWETQYSHLKQGSIVVEPGDRVARGQELGQIGLSGRTEFPHVEFTVRHQGTPLDPFTALPGEAGCDSDGVTLWSDSAKATLDYIAPAVLGAGFAPQRPDAETARDGGYAGRQLPPDAGILAFWVNLMGPQAGYVQHFRVTGPNGGEVLDHTQALSRDQARRFSFVGRRKPEVGWPDGCYTGTYVLKRDGEQLIRTQRTVGLGARCPG
jgi:hypothetical protein